MTKLQRLLASRFHALLLGVLVTTGCSVSPYSPIPSPMIVSGLLPGGAMQVARVEAPDATDSLPVCPGTGHSSCETNWNLLRQGLTAAEVANWLGHPAQQTGPDIYIEKVVAEWRYENEGVIYFENEELRYVDMPVSFVYPL